MNQKLKVFHRLKRKIDVVLDSNFKLKKIDKSKPTIFVFGVSSQVNYGDLAISLAQEKFIKNNLFNYNYVEILDYQSKKAVNVIKKVITPSDIVMVSGGGNLGNLYDFSENNRKNVIRNFPENKIISFPQSMYYTKDIEGEERLVEDSSFYSESPNFILTARESLSYKNMKENFTNKILFCPDIVLSLKTPDVSPTRKNVIAIMRNDVERLQDDKKNELLKQVKEKYQVKFSDNNIPNPRIVKKKHRQEVVFKRLLEIKKSEFIITDRLHGMLFSAITRTPCVVFNNSNNKVKFSYLNWLKSDPLIFYAENKSVQEIISWISEVKNLSNVKYDYNENFKKYIDYIKNENA